MPSIIKFRGKLRVRARVMVDGQEASKLYPDASKKSQRDAATWESIKKKELQEKPSENHTEYVSVDQWAVSFLNETKNLSDKGKCSTKTYDERRWAFDRILKDIEDDTPVDFLDESFCGKFLKKQYIDRSGHAANKDRKNLSKAWDWGRSEFQAWPRANNPFRSVKKFPEVRSPRYIPPESDFWKVYESTTDLQDRIILLTLLMTAARRSEVFRLKRSDIDLDNGRIRLWTRKRVGGAWEYDWIPMTRELKAAVVQWLKIRLSHNTIDKKHVFVCLNTGDAETESYERYGQPFKDRSKFMRKLCENAKVNPFGYHSIRHLAATILYKKGKTIAEIQAFLRHKNPNTTVRYLKSLGLEHIRDTIEEGIKVPAEIVQFNPLDTNKNGLKKAGFETI